VLKAVYTSRFEKDLKLARKRRKNLNKLKTIILALLNQENLPAKYRDHQLIGVYNNRREYHVESDWLLIYKPEDNIIIFERTGTHSDLFK